MPMHLLLCLSFFTRSMTFSPESQGQKRGPEGPRIIRGTSLFVGSRVTDLGSDAGRIFVDLGMLTRHFMTSRKQIFMFTALNLTYT